MWLVEIFLTLVIELETIDEKVLTPQVHSGTPKDLNKYKSETKGNKNSNTTQKTNVRNDVPCEQSHLGKVEIFQSRSIEKGEVVSDVKASKKFIVITL